MPYLMPFIIVMILIAEEASAGVADPAVVIIVKDFIGDNARTGIAYPAPFSS